MSEFVANCPRCGSKNMTFDLIAEHLVEIHYQWQHWYETFCICRHCKRATIFVLAQNTDSDKNVVHKNGLVNLKTSVNRYMRNEGFISLKDTSSTRPPEYLPPNIDAAFREGAICMSVKCFNAAGTMFRLCIDLATCSMLPEGEVKGLNSRVRRNLGLRLPWLFDNGVWSGQVKTDTQLSNFSQGKISFKTIWVFVTQERMETMTVIKHFNILDHVTSGFVPGLINDVSDPLGFKRVEKAFYYGIIPAVSLPAHTANHAVLF